MPIAMINDSTVCTDDEVKSYTEALQIQLNRDFGPVWGVDTRLEFFSKSDVVPPHYWQLAFLDNSDQAGALGYHDVTPEGHPLGKVFAASDKQYGYSVSVTASHELLEMLADPGINRCAAQEDANGNVSGLVAWEVGDPVEADKYGYEINGVLVSNFIYPNWFGGVAANVFDHMKICTAPGQLLPGGYVSIWTPSGGWNQNYGPAATEKYPNSRKYSTIPPPGSRRERRARGIANWMRSNPRIVAP